MKARRWFFCFSCGRRFFPSWKLDLHLKRHTCRLPRTVGGSPT